MTSRELLNLLLAARVTNVERMSAHSSEDRGWDGGRSVVIHLIGRYGQKITLTPCRDEERNGPGTLEVSTCVGSDGTVDDYEIVGIV